MFFNSFHFVLFFSFVLMLVGLLRNRVRERNVLLLIASYYFYGCWDWRFLSLIVISTIVDYVCGRLFDVREEDIGRSLPRTRRHRLILITSLGSNLGILGFFKYYNFFIRSAVDALSTLGISTDVWTLQIILPVGISFYTFQTLSYTIDLYYGRMKTERNLLNFAVYVAFFPQLVAGPIERASNLLPQMGTPRTMSWQLMRSGLFLVVVGLFKKVVIADNVAGVADVVFSAESVSGLSVMLGVYAFALQIYCDFSGYSDIARGTARCMGFELMLNFNLPYFATNPSDFWRRWHISLSTWLRDYLYIPLGGNRFGAVRTYVNLMATMVLGGLWHGAAWTFLVWGGYQGGLLCVHRLIQPRMKQLFHPKGEGWVHVWSWVRVVIFFHFVCLGWLLFRAESMAQVWHMLGAIFFEFRLNPSGLDPLTLDDCITLFSSMAVLFVAQLIEYRSKDLEIVLRWPLVARALVYLGLYLGILWFGEYGGESFIYFQF